MSDEVGRVAISSPQGRGGPSFMPPGMMRGSVWGNSIMGTVEGEVERLVNNSYLIAKKILNENRDLLEHLTGTLLEQEVVSAEEFQMMLVEFKAKTISYAVLSEERNRDKLPFQALPTTV